MKIKKILTEIKKRLNDDENFFYPYTEESSDGKSYIWVGVRTGLIGTEFCHYEFIENDNEPSILSLEVHFNETEKKEFESLIKHLPSELESKEWNYDNGFRRIVFKNRKLKFDDASIIDNAFKDLKILDKYIGEKLEEIINNCENLKPLNLRKQKLGQSRKIVNGRVNHSRQISEESYKSKHGSLQKKLKKQLEVSGEYEEVKPEVPLGEIRVDIYGLKKIDSADVYDIFEVKPYESPTDCIREAIGQLLLYRCNFERSGYKVGCLYICGSNRLCEYDKLYLDSIKEICNALKIYYRPIN